MGGKEYRSAAAALKGSFLVAALAVWASFVGGHASSVEWAEKTRSTPGMQAILCRRLWFGRQMGVRMVKGPPALLRTILEPCPGTILNESFRRTSEGILDERPRDPRPRDPRTPIDAGPGAAIFVDKLNCTLQDELH